jgi:hypothetical protein
MSVASGGQARRGGWFGERWKYEILCQRGFLPVPDVLLKEYANLRPPLTGTQVLFVLQLMEHKRSADAPFPSYGTMARRMGVSNKTLQRCAASLERHGYLRREYRNRGPRSNGVDQRNRFHLDGLFDALREQLSRNEPRRARRSYKAAA